MLATGRRIGGLRLAARGRAEQLSLTQHPTHRGPLTIIHSIDSVSAVASNRRARRRGRERQPNDAASAGGRRGKWGMCRAGLQPLRVPLLAQPRLLLSTAAATRSASPAPLHCAPPPAAAAVGRPTARAAVAAEAFTLC